MSETRLSDIERTCDRTLLIVEQLSEKVETRIEHDDAWREKMDLILMGDGNGRKGHNVRIDRLEQTAERQKWITRTLGGTLMVVLLKSVLELLA